MIGLLFSGQGAQKTGLTHDLYLQEPRYRQIIDQASAVLNWDLPTLMFDDRYADKLAQTQYAQPVILAQSYGLFQLIRDYLPAPSEALGLSLGEYSALACGDYLDFATILKVIRRRGELMQHASDQVHSKMVALMHASLAQVQTACQRAQTHGVVAVANVNTPQQIVIGGEIAAVDAATAWLQQQDRHIRKVTLAVSGAFHTPLMQPIQAQLQDVLAPLVWQKGKFRVWSTTTQQVFTPENLTATLTSQLVSPTNFAATLTSLVDQLTAVIEVGPGRTLLGFTKKILPTLPRYQIDSIDKLAATRSALGG